MNNVEMNKKVLDYCNVVFDEVDYTGKGCLIEEQCVTCAGKFIDNPDKLKEAYEKIKDIDITTLDTPDNINHPTHYCREGAIESIDEMELIFGKQAVKHFCLCNAWKYRYRASAKNGDEDLKKSDWYIRKYLELIESESDE